MYVGVFIYHLFIVRISAQSHFARFFKKIASDPLHAFTVFQWRLIVVVRLARDVKNVHFASHVVSKKVPANYRALNK